MISCLRRLVVAAGKKSYTFLMGKPNPAKLGNFPEVRMARHILIFVEQQTEQWPGR